MHLSSQCLHGFPIGDTKAIAQQRVGNLFPCDATEFNLPLVGPNLGCKVELSRNEIQANPYRRDPSLFTVVNQFVFDQGDVAAMFGAHQDEGPQATG